MVFYLYLYFFADRLIRTHRRSKLLARHIDRTGLICFYFYIFYFLARRFGSSSAIATILNLEQVPKTPFCVRTQLSYEERGENTVLPATIRHLYSSDDFGVRFFVVAK